MLALSSQTEVQNNIAMALVGGSDDGLFQSTGSKLIAIFYKQYERRCLLLLTRAFQRWHAEYPLHNKCDELHRQLKERNNLLENVRGSYLKDVVSIKYHLNQLAGIDPHLQVQKFKEQLFDLHHNLPSVDIRDVIEKAKKGWNEQSSQLFRDTLIDSGLIDPETAKTLNAWEQSRSFKRMMRVKRGPSYNFPDAGGESLILAAPTTHKLFVRYCQDCIGLIALVKNWNQEVEASLKFKADYGRIDEKIEEFKKLIRSLEDIVERKEKEVIDLTARNTELEEAKEWFEKWSKMRIAEETKSHRKEQQVIMTNMMAMAEEDKVATLRKLRDVLQQQLEEALRREQELYRQLRFERSEREMEVETRVKLADELRSFQSDRHRMAVEIDRLNAARRQDSLEKSQLEHRLENLEKLNNELQIALDVKESQFEEQRKLATERITDLTDQLQEVSKDLQVKEDEVDNLREESRKQKGMISKQTGEIIQLKEAIEALKNEMANMTIKAEPKKISKFRVAVIAIRSLFRLGFALQKRKYRDLGLTGYKILYKQQQDELRMLSNERRELHNRLMDIIDQNDDLIRQNAKLLSKIDELENLSLSQQEQMQALKQQIKDHQLQLLQMQSEKDSLSKLIKSYEANDSMGKVYIEKSIQRISQRIKVFVRLQRSLSNELGRLFLTGRSSLQVLNIESFMNDISKDMRMVDRLFDGTISSANGNSNANAGGFSPTKSLPMAMRKQVYLKEFRHFVEQMKYWFKVNKPTHVFPISMEYQEWLHWMTAMNIDAFTGKEKTGSNEQFLRLKISNYHIEEKKKLKNLKLSWQQDMKRLEEFVEQVRHCFQAWKVRLSTCGELDQAYRALLEKYNILLQQKMTSDRTVVTKLSEKPNNRAKLLKMKGNYTHLLETDITTYLQNVVGAIENVQQEYVKEYSNRGSSTVSGQVSGQVSGAHSPNRRSFVGTNNGISAKIGSASHDAASMEDGDQLGILIGDDVLIGANSNSVSGGVSNKSTRVKPRAPVPADVDPIGSLHDIAENSLEEIHGEESVHDIVLPPLGVADSQSSLVATDAGHNQFVAAHTAPMVSMPSTNNKVPSSGTGGSSKQLLGSGPSSTSQSHKEKPPISSPSGKTKDREKSNSQAGSPMKSARSEKRGYSPKGQRGSTNDVGTSSKNNGGGAGSDSSKFISDLNDTKKGNVVNANMMDEFANDDDDMLDPDLDGEEGDEESFNDELEMMKKEAMLFLKHEQSLKSKVKSVEEENQAYQELNSNLQQEVEMLRREYANFYNEKYKLTKELSKLLREFETVCHENSLLREMVEDGYRYFSGEKNEILEAMDYFLREQERKRLEALDRMKSQETQVDCVACEMLEISKMLKGQGQNGQLTRSGSHKHAHGPGHANYHAHKFPTAEEYYQKYNSINDRPDDSSTMAEVHENYAKAYGDNVILIPRSRSQTGGTTVKAGVMSEKSQPKAGNTDKMVSARSNPSNSLTSPTGNTGNISMGISTEPDLLAEELAFKLKSFRDEYDQFISDQQLAQQNQPPTLTFPTIEGSLQGGGSGLDGGGVSGRSNAISNLSGKSKTGTSFVEHVLKALSTTENSIQVSDLLRSNSSKNDSNSPAGGAARGSTKATSVSAIANSSDKDGKIAGQLSPTFRPKSSRPTSAIPSGNVGGNGFASSNNNISSKSQTKASVAFEQTLFNDSLPQFGSLDITGMDKLGPTSNSVVNSAPQSRPVTASKRRGAPSPAPSSTLGNLVMDQSNEDLGNAVYKNQHLFNYAKAYLRPQSAVPLSTPNANTNDSKKQKEMTQSEKIRPKSGNPVLLAHSGSDPRVATNNNGSSYDNNEASKFRKIRQIPTSSVTGSVNSTLQPGIAGSSPTIDQGLRKSISTSSPMLRKLMGGPPTSLSLSGKVNSVNAAAIAAKKESRQVSNTAAFLQQNYISKKNNGRFGDSFKGGQDVRYFDDETTGTPGGATFDENDNIDDFIVQDQDDDAKSFT